jgi:hypothetical protein
MHQHWPAQQLPQPSHYQAAHLEPQPVISKIPNQRFLPYVQLFFEHLNFIMPVVDKNLFLDAGMYSPTHHLPTDIYAFLCALCAATIVQLDAAIQVPQFESLPGRPAEASDMFIQECLETRTRFDYIDNPSTLTVMTSFFVFAYYGNQEKSEKAWHFLQESISFTEVMNMDDENALVELEPLEAQWRRRLYWLLFITERQVSMASTKDFQLTCIAQSILDTASQKLPSASYHKSPSSLWFRGPAALTRLSKPRPLVLRYRRQFRQRLERHTQAVLVF